MGYSIRKEEIIKYSPEHLREFEVDRYEWIDNLNFTIDPFECLANHEEYVKVAKELFLKEGWDGDGEVKLMWIPPFAVREEEEETEDWTMGVTVWHVKQLEDGLSWILFPPTTKTK